MEYIIFLSDILSRDDIYVAISLGNPTPRSAGLRFYFPNDIKTGQSVAICLSMGFTFTYKPLMVSIGAFISKTILQEMYMVEMYKKCTRNVYARNVYRIHNHHHQPPAGR